MLSRLLSLLSLPFCFVADAYNAWCWERRYRASRRRARLGNPGPGSGGFWNPSPWYLAQVVHVLAGPAILFAGIHHGWSVAWVAGVFLAVTAVKEFVVDVSPFEGDSWWGSTQDWLCYAAGMGGSLLALAWFWVGVAMVGCTVAGLFGMDLWKQRHGAGDVTKAL